MGVFVVKHVVNYFSRNRSNLHGAYIITKSEENSTENVLFCKLGVHNNMHPISHEFLSRKKCTENANNNEVQYIIVQVSFGN